MKIPPKRIPHMLHAREGCNSTSSDGGTRAGFYRKAEERKVEHCDGVSE